MSDEIITIEDSDEADEETDPLRLSPLPLSSTSFADNKPAIVLRSPNFTMRTIRPIHIPAEKFPLPSAIQQTILGKSITLKRIHPTRVLPPVKPKVITIDDDNAAVATSSTDLTIFELFHKFTMICAEKDTSEDMAKIVAKLKSIYEQAIPNYVASREFRELVELKTSQMISDPDPGNACVHLKPVYDELRLRKLRLNGSQPTSAANGASPRSSIKDGDEGDSKMIEQSGLESKKLRNKIKLLETALKKCHRRIATLEAEEVDFSDEEDSTYVQMQRYKDRFNSIHRTLCSYTGETDKMNRVRVVCKTPFLDVNRCIEAFVNKTETFPDFRDISSIIEKTVEREKLALTPTQIHNLAAEQFQKVGEQMQKFRQNRDWNNLTVFLENSPDPADRDPSLLATLTANQESGNMKLDEVLRTYATKQDEKKLVAEEVTDEQANQSAGEEEEGDDEEEDEEEAKDGDKDSNSDDNAEVDYFGDGPSMSSPITSSGCSDLLSALQLKKKTPREPELILDVETGLFKTAKNNGDETNSSAKIDVSDVGDVSSVNLKLENDKDIASVTALPGGAEKPVKTECQLPATVPKKKVSSGESQTTVKDELESKDQSLPDKEAAKSIATELSQDDNKSDNTSVADAKPEIGNEAAKSNATELSQDTNKSDNTTVADAKPEIDIKSDCDDTKPTLKFEECDTPSVADEVTIESPSDNEENTIPEIVAVKQVLPSTPTVVPRKPADGKSVLNTSKISRLQSLLPNISVIRRAGNNTSAPVGTKRVTKVVTKQESTCVRSEVVAENGLTVVETKCKTIRVRSFGNMPCADAGSKNSSKKLKLSVIDDDDDDVIVLD